MILFTLVFFSKKKERERECVCEMKVTLMGTS